MVISYGQITYILSQLILRMRLKAVSALAANAERCATYIDGGESGYLRPMLQARFRVQAQASLVLWGCMSEGSLEAPQEEVPPAGAYHGRRCETRGGMDSRGLGGDAAVGGAHGRADVFGAVRS